MGMTKSPRKRGFLENGAGRNFKIFFPREIA
jgi:hypothetical protein